MFRYKEIYADLKRDIMTNRYPEGELLPTQEDLAKKYEVSRITLKKALALLSEEGLIDSKAGSGTIVRHRIKNDNDEILPLDAPIGGTYSHQNQDVKSKIVDFNARLPQENEQKILDLKPTDPIFEIKRVRLINNRRYSFEHTIMPTSIDLNEEVLNGSIYDYLSKEYGIQLTDARRVVYATSANSEISEALNIKEADPVFVIEQTAYDQNGTAFEFSTSYFASDYSRFFIEVHRSHYY